MRSRGRLSTRLGALALAAAFAWPAPLAAQHTEPPTPAAYVLSGVTVVQADGERREDVSIVVRGRFIEAIGADAVAPADAEVLDGEALVVYPGIVDADGDAGLELPEPELEWDTIQSWAPPRALQGFTPARRAVDFVKATGGDLEEQRRRGVVAAAVHPSGPVMPGRGTTLLFRKGADRPSELVVEPVLGPTFTFEDARGVYPSTLFGVIAFMRQQFEDARRQQQLSAEFASSPRGLTAPAWDEDMEVLQQVLSGETRVFFRAQRADDIRRVLGLAVDYGFDPVIVGGREAWQVTDLLTQADVPVLVSLDFPEPERWTPDEEAAEALDAAALDEKQRLERAYANAGRLAEAGVSFALTSGGGEADLLDGARKAVEYGLAEPAALRALTAGPASLLGLPYATRIETGLPATFIVADGPLFDEETRIAYTFVEGELEEGGGDEAEEDGAPQPGAGGAR